MSSSERSKNENGCDFISIKPIEVFEYPSQASKIIWSVNSKNILQVFSQIIEFVTNNKISIQMSLYLIKVISRIRIKDIKLFTELYQKILNQFSCIQFENFEPAIDGDEILHLNSTESPFYYIAWDKVDDLKSKFPNLDINEETIAITPLDCAIKYGSEFCFNYLKNLGAKYTCKSKMYAVQGGNINIFMQMIEDGKSFDDMIYTALKYRNYEIAEYLKTNFEHTLPSIAESMYWGNYDVASYLLFNGMDYDEIYLLFLFIFFIVL